MAGAFAGETAQLAKRSDYFGWWLTAKAEPTIIDHGEGDGKGGALIHEKMLLFIEPAEEGDYLVRCHFYEWPPDESTLVGPAAGSGVYDPTTGDLLLSGISQGESPVKLLPTGEMLYLHAKSMPNRAVASARLLRHLDDASAYDLETRLIAKQRTLKAAPK